MTVMKKEGSSEYPASAYLVVEDLQSPSTWHLRVRDASGNPDHHLMGAAYAALYENYRGNTYQGPGKEEATSKLRKLYSSEGIAWPGTAKGIPDEFMVTYGGEVKALEDGKVAGYLVRFSDANSTDLAGDFFTSQTDFGPAKTSVTLYNHGFDKKIGRKKIGEATLKMDDVGIWVESQLSMRDRYEKAIYELAQKGKLGWSSGTASHLVERKAVGKANQILSWPLGLDASLTPTPAEPRNSAFSMKAITESDIEQLTQDAETNSGSDSTKNLSIHEEVMDPNKPTASVSAEDLKGAVLEALEKQNARIEAEKQKKVQVDEMKTTIAELIEKAMQAAPANNGGAPSLGANVLRKTRRGDDAFKSFSYFIKTGDPSPIHTGEAYDEWMRTQEFEAKTNYALLESTQYQGQEAVPTEVAAIIHEKRNAVSVVRGAGATVFPAKSNALVIPIEKVIPQKFGITTIDNSNSFTTQTSQPMDKLTGTVFMFTYNVPTDLQLIDDATFNVEGWLARRIGRGWGLTENQYFLVGAGTTEPQGAVVGATAGTIAASATAVTAAEVVDNYYKLPGEYRDKAVWVMRGATEGAVRKLTSSTFPFVGTGGTQGAVGQGGGTNSLNAGTGWLVAPDARVYNSDEMDTLAASHKPILVGNFEAGYAIVERKILTVLRDPYSSASKGIIQTWWYFREGGGVMDALAFYYLSTPSA